MHGNVGDWVVIKGTRLDDPYRRGEIVELVHGDGTPPYHVHWLDTGRATLVFPGPDSYIEDRTAGLTTDTGPTALAGRAGRH